VLAFKAGVFGLLLLVNGIERKRTVEDVLELGTDNRLYLRGSGLR
jgi:hypothetical protein